MINKQQIFNLIDDQIAAYNAIMYKAKKQAESQEKSVIIVKGGPGTGKSVIALEVMGELLRQNKKVFHTTGGAAFTKTIRNIVGKRAEKLFKYFYAFTKQSDNSIDVVIADEAHRLRKNSADWRVPFNLKSNSPQVIDIIRPAKLSVFFIDEHQVVRPNEIGSVKLIRDAAQLLGVEDSNILEFELKTQFRCSGSDAYLIWLEDILHIRKSEFAPFDTKMEFKILDTPEELKHAIDAQNKIKKNSARITAGFCWPWSKPNIDGTLVNDVAIGTFAMPWEKKSEFWKWATYDSGMEQVGTVYTAQGFEFDYIGVIWGKDLAYDPTKQEWIAQPKYSQDKTLLRNNVKLVEHLKNVYRVLLSRAHKGVYLFFTDKNTANYFRNNLKII